MTGAVPYLEFLKEIHTQLGPRGYLEIGVRHGDSLALAQCPAIGVDPLPTVTQELRASTSVRTQTSDRYFQENPSGPEFPIDLAFIDGLHTFEQALRDFNNVERIALPGTIVVFDDIFPNHPAQANRIRSTLAWTGDVWRIISCLESYRPDLVLLKVDIYPTGLLLVGNLSPTNDALARHFEPITGVEPPPNPPDSILNRQAALHPSNHMIADFIAYHRAARAD
jgi:hypothetical protein